MTGKDHAVLVDHDRCNPAELAHAGRDLLDLPGAVRPGVAGIHLQVVDRSHRYHRGERLGQRLEVGCPGFRLAHHGLVDLLMVVSVGRLALRNLNHDTPLSISPSGAPAWGREVKD